MSVFLEQGRGSPARKAAHCACALLSGHKPGQKKSPCLLSFPYPRVQGWGRTLSFPLVQAAKCPREAQLLTESARGPKGGGQCG